MSKERRADYLWALDLDSENAADEIVSWRRPGVLRPADDVVPLMLFDFKNGVRTAYVQCISPFYGVLNDLAKGS